MSPRPPSTHQTRPRTYDINFSSILAFPLRICNPPPAVAKVRSCGVTPLFKVQLEDVLDRKHLPPLGLKDFEEWLLYVEMSPENLYFTLWLREYRQRYNAWMAQNKIQREMDGEFRMYWETHHSPSLAMLYARAKQTFFTPNSPYELNLPSSLLAVFHTSMESPHPDPAIFTDVAIETYRMLDESLRRFVSAQFNNVGNNRVLCGIIAGIFFSLIGSVPPIIVNFTRSESRWLRMTAFPGLFIGLTILIAALNGVCLGVYVFGDLRQLRKFELARPPISRPQPIADPKPKTPSIHPETAPVPCTLPSFIDNSPSTLEKSASTVDARIAHLARPPSTTSDHFSITSCSDDGSVGEHGEAEIHISPAFYDDSSCGGEGGIIQADFTFPERGDGQLSPINSEFTATATFIHPFDATSMEVMDCDKLELCADQRQPIDDFNFDSLPALKTKRKISKQPSNQYDRDCCRNSVSLDMPSPIYPAYMKNATYPYPIEAQPSSGFLERYQSRCGDIKQWRLRTESTPTPVSPVHGGNPYNTHILHKSHRSLDTEATNESSETKVHQRFKLIRAVPAFAVPLTKILSPVIRRGQWEIVIRSAAIAFLTTWFVVGGLLAIPPRTR
ncbi:hypothetical protein FA15DRAFT_701742 [Coprinopsis marcescibilis]|uniref:RGS domain-containing protein n=1 Tax=Coprinopsis marcescibilis TaxID=230819 RepID=A0A5C3L6H3_COPMA|nr:hypothetical protein FA15DRAFT_701742 [Coprinopsis marcescibilis]